MWICITCLSNRKFYKGTGITPIQHRNHVVEYNYWFSYCTGCFKISYIGKNGICECKRGIYTSITHTKWLNCSVYTKHVNFIQKPTGKNLSKSIPRKYNRRLKI